MLQIISGKFFTSSERHIHDGKGITYSNYSWPIPIQTCIATLEPTDLIGINGSILSYVISYKNQIEKDGLLVRTGDAEITDQFRLLCSFGLRAFFDRSWNAVTLNCREKPSDSAGSYLPCQFVPRQFSPQIQGTMEEITEFESLVDKIIGLQRPTYKAVMAAIRNINQALHTLNYNIDLAYSLVIYSLESLSQQFDSFEPSWLDYQEATRNKLDKQFKNIDNTTAEQIRHILINENHLRLQKRFTEFVCRHIQDEFFLNNAANNSPSIQMSELHRALKNAYNLRSGFVHKLEPIQEQLRIPQATNGDVFRWQGEPYLTLRGLLRIAQHVIRNFVTYRPQVEKETIDWRSELPGRVQFELAPQYWIWHHEKFNSSQAHQKLTGFLQQLESAMQSNEPITNLRDLMDKFELSLPIAKREDKLSMFALYYIYNSIIAEDFRCPNYKEVCETYENISDTCSIQMLIIKFFENVAWQWSASECVDSWNSYIEKRYRKNGLRLPLFLEISVLLEIGNKYYSEGNIDEYHNWYRMALLDAPDRKTIQKAIAEAKEKLECLSFEKVFAITKSNGTETSTKHA